MKEPKSFRHPRLYWTPNPKSQEAHFVIIYPDGSSERSCTPLPGYFVVSFFDQNVLKKYRPCWDVRQISRGPYHALSKMKEFCKIHKIERIFVGEIK